MRRQARTARGCLASTSWGRRGDTRLEALVHEGYDAGTGYNYPRAGMPDWHRPVGAMYSTIVDGYEQIWYSIAVQQLIDHAPVTEPGWDSRPWHGDKALVRTGRDPEKFEDMLRRARVFTDRYPIAGGRKLVLIEAWNEPGEGAAIEPIASGASPYLDAVRRIFSRERGPHRDLTPKPTSASPFRVRLRPARSSRAVGCAGRGLSPRPARRIAGNGGLRPDGPLVYW